MSAPGARQGDTTSHGGVIIKGCLTVTVEGQLAARVSDLHLCPVINPGNIPHLGGPILPPGEPTVHIEGLPAARVSDWLLCAGPLDVISRGATRTFIGFPMPPPPFPPGITIPGDGGESSVYQVNWIWLGNYVVAANVGGGVNVAVGWNAGAAVSVGAGALGVVAVAVVVYPFVSRTFGVAPVEGDACCGVPDASLFKDISAVEGVRDDADVYLL